MPRIRCCGCCPSADRRITRDVGTAINVGLLFGALRDHRVALGLNSTNLRSGQQRWQRPQIALLIAAVSSRLRPGDRRCDTMLTMRRSRVRSYLAGWDAGVVVPWWSFTKSVIAAAAQLRRAQVASSCRSLPFVMAEIATFPKFATRKRCQCRAYRRGCARPCSPRGNRRARR